MLSKRTIVFLALGFLSFTVFSCTNQPSVINNNNTVIEVENKTVENAKNKVRLLYTANLCKFMPEYNEIVGNETTLKNMTYLSRLSTLLQKKRNEGFETLTISGGNDYGGAFYDEFYGVATAVLLDKLGYNIITPDKTEFKDGESIYDASIKDTNYTLLSGSTDFEARSLIRRIKHYAVKEINGYKIGILTSNNMYNEKFGRSHATTQSQPDYVKNCAETLNFRLKKMHEEGTQLSILLGDIDKYAEITRMLKEDMLNVDLVIFPSVNNKYFKSDKYDMQGAVTLLGKKKTPLFVYNDDCVDDLYVLQIDIEFSKNAEGKTTFNHTHELFEVTGETPEDPEVKKMVDGFISQLP